MNRTYRGTRYACYTGYFVQAIVNNLAPLLFIIFQTQFRVTYTMISTLVLINFVTQLIVDVLSVKLVDRIGHRVSLCAAHILCAAGFAARADGPAVCRAGDRDGGVCDRWRVDRSAYQPHGGKFARRRKSGGNESAALVLLLGAGGGGADLHAGAASDRLGALDMAAALLVGGADTQRDQLFNRAAGAASRRGQGHVGAGAAVL